MPIQYSNIIDEHEAVRKHCGVFDVSHMGEVWVSGPDAERYVNHIFTNNIAGAPLHKIYYGMLPTLQPGDRLLVCKTIVGPRLYRNLDIRPVHCSLLHNIFHLLEDLPQK